MGELARHQMAANWAREMEDHLPWLEREDRQQFLEHALSLILEEWSDERLALHLVIEHPDPETLAGDIVRTLEEIQGHGQ